MCHLDTEISLDFRAVGHESQRAQPVTQGDEQSLCLISI